MKKILLLPLIIALTSNIYAIPSPWYVLAGLLAFSGAENTNIRKTHTEITNQFGGETPVSQIEYIANLPKGCELSAEKYLRGIEEATLRIIEYSQNVDDDLIITSVYKGKDLLGYELFMRNEDGTCEVVHLNEALAIGHSYELRQSFDVLAKNTGSEALVVTSGKGKGRKVIRYNPAIANKHEDKPLDSSTQCTITEYKVNGKVVRIERTGDCDEL